MWPLSIPRPGAEEIPHKSFLMHIGNPVAGWERTEKQRDKLTMVDILLDHRDRRTGD